MGVLFRAVEELRPGDRWAGLFDERWPGYHRWFLSEGDAARPSYLACARALRAHMPELLPTYEALVALAGGGDAAARFLSLYRPPPYLTGCSQAVWMRGEPLLARNYDYSPRLWDAVLLGTSWTGRRVVAMTDCLWGVLDGINEAGLAASLAFGGRKVVGDGFGIPIMLRYVLELCDTAEEASRALARIPTHMSYNVTLLDAAGAHLTVYLAPDRAPSVTRRRVATNHQRPDDWGRFALATASLEREHYLHMCLTDADESPERFRNRFLEPPLYADRFDKGWGTLYTAVYRPTACEATYRWPDATLSQTCSNFQEIALAIEYRTTRHEERNP